MRDLHKYAHIHIRATFVMRSLLHAHRCGVNIYAVFCSNMRIFTEGPGLSCVHAYMRIDAEYAYMCDFPEYAHFHIRAKFVMRSHIYADRCKESVYA